MVDCMIALGDRPGVDRQQEEGHYMAECKAMGTGQKQTGNRERGTTWQTGSNGGQARSR